MAVRSVSIFHINPGKRQEFLKNAAEAKKHLERLGGRWRAAETTVGGPNTGNVVATIEFDDIAAFAAFTQKQAKDAEWMAFQARTLGTADPAASLVSRSLLTDLEV